MHNPKQEIASFFVIFFIAQKGFIARRAAANETPAALCAAGVEKARGKRAFLFLGNVPVILFEQVLDRFVEQAGFGDPCFLRQCVKQRNQLVFER